MNDFFNNMSLLNVFLKWKWHLVVIVIVAAFIGVVISSPWFMEPKFSSTATLYPSNIQPYSDESETEQMLQWLNSRSIMDSMIHKYDLARHYGIDTNHRYYYSIMEHLYRKNVRVNKTQFESVTLEVRDVDPLKARDMVYSIIDFYDAKIRNSHRIKWNEVVESHGRYLAEKRAELDTVLQRHYELRTNYELIDYENQTREVTRGYLRTVDGTNASHVNREAVDRIKGNLQEKGGDFIYYTNLIPILMQQIAIIQNDYEGALYHFTKEFTHSNLVSHPVVADKKVHPIRWLILAYSVLAALFFSVIVIALIENSRSIQNKITEGLKA
jgi:hypothetical protein